MHAAPAELSQRNRRVGLYALLAALAMLGLGYASVPLYRLFCQVTGFQGTTQRVSAAQAASVKVAAATMSIRFDGNTDRDLPWEFKPQQVTQTVRLGERNLAIFTAKNLSNRPIVGRASYNVSPDDAGKFFNKVQCFCFTEQTLEPGQEVRMPVIYFVDPSITKDEDGKDIRQITLSYTFHEDKDASADLAAKAKVASKGLDRAGNAR
ncbi:cytochrome c oxidase assembly protein [Novosphingobium flavum]|uniref:Cytochrome c oxidase assembly protein CtaG n=1 Tax=Novosphingobium flavum TaxID=1778672 RepID=A0A7X1FSZ5_9SPHN|nr:cytochrome c oxidase assembly protein [Novosphingobium flavum]MBC2665797.1 cytochrome c oxidase assembly protein [Novosphingobium flavum]